jgi:putative ABC transport system permease protein
VRGLLSLMWMNLRGIPARLGLSLVITFGTASVVAVLVTVLSMATGLTDTMTAEIPPENVLVIRKGALAESLSSLSREAVLAVETAPGIALRGGRPAVSPEVVLSVDLPRLDGEGLSAVFVRGITEAGWLLRPELEPVSGRRFQPGRFEVLVGQALATQLAGVALGDVLHFHGSRWTVVGIYAHGGAADSQIVADAATLLAASQRNVYSTVTAALASGSPGGSTFDAFKEAVEENPQLVVEAVRSAEYYQRQAESTAGIMGFVAYVVSAIMALGALFGAVNTMYTAVAVRTKEIATLRALGFGGASVVASVLSEALVLSLLGALLGVAFSWLLFGGMYFDGGGQLAALAVELQVGLPVVALGVVWAGVIGLLAGLFPALRAARLPVADGLRVDG